MGDAIVPPIRACGDQPTNRPAGGQRPRARAAWPPRARGLARPRWNRTAGRPRTSRGPASPHRRSRPRCLDRVAARDVRRNHPATRLPRVEVARRAALASPGNTRSTSETPATLVALSHTTREHSSVAMTPPLLVGLAVALPGARRVRRRAQAVRAASRRVRPRGGRGRGVGNRTTRVRRRSGS